MTTQVQLTDQERAVFEQLHTDLLAWGEFRPKNIGFDMGSVITTVNARGRGRLGEKVTEPDCGAACCMIGVIVMRHFPVKFCEIVDDHLKDEFSGDTWGRMCDQAKAALGGDTQKFDKLFYPCGCFYKASPEQAARVVRRMLGTGEIDWATEVPELWTIEEE